jgi:hypothetical protein
VGHYYSAVYTLVGDRAPGHGAKIVKAVRAAPDKAAPSITGAESAERVFEELRREVEGEVYGTLENKMAAVERELMGLAASPERVQRLTGWAWIGHAMARLPPNL